MHGRDLARVSIASSASASSRSRAAMSTRLPASSSADSAMSTLASPSLEAAHCG